MAGSDGMGWAQGQCGLHNQRSLADWYSFINVQFSLISLTTELRLVPAPHCSASPVDDSARC